MKKKIMSALLASVLCVSMVLPTVAIDVIDQEEGVHTYKTGTDVYAGVILDNENPEIGGDPRIRVTVPTMFAFVVNGTRLGGETAKQPLSVEDRTILVPNFTVSVLDRVDANGDPIKETNNTRPFSLDVTGDGKMQFNNYSTRAAIPKDVYNKLSSEQKKLYPYDMASQTTRVGIEVDIIGYIENEGTEKARNYWEHVAKIIPEYTSDSKGNQQVAADERLNQFKKFTLSVNAIPFGDKEAADLKLIPFSDIKMDRFYMNKKIKLNAPRADVAGASDETTNWFAKSPATQDIEFSVDVGGLRGNYTQIEQSAKIGTIVWTASYTYKNDGTDGKNKVPTAPDNNYQETPETLTTDPLPEP